MKRILFLIIIISFLIYLYYNGKSKDIINYTFIEDDEYVIVYYEFNNTVSALKRPRLSDDPIKDIYDYLTIYKNNCPIYLYSSIPNSSILKYYYILNNNVHLYVSEFNDNELSLMCIIYSYKALGYDNTYIYNDELIYSLE